MPEVITYGERAPVVGDRGRWSLPAMLEERASTHGACTFLSFPAETVNLTFAETWQQAQVVASRMLDAGAAPGDRVLIMAANSSQLVLAWFGAVTAGLTEVPINTAYVGAFLEHQVKTSSPTLAVIDAGFAERIAANAAARRSLRHVYVIGDGDDLDDAMAVLGRAGLGASRFDALQRGAPAALPPALPQAIASVLFTSGTTGLSKGVLMPNAQVHFFAEEQAHATGLSDRDVYLTSLPLFHGNAQFLSVYPSLICGARVVVRPKFSASSWLDWLRADGVTVTNCLGVMMDFLSKQPEQPNDADNPLRCLQAAPTAWSCAQSFQARFGIEMITEGFGLTEISIPILTPYGAPRPQGAAGVAVDQWFDVRLADPETDEEVVDGQLGELMVRPKVPWITSQGYMGVPDRTAEAFRNLWFHTGDGLRRDGDGWYYFVDRLKDAIRRRGENISSFEVEQPLLEHPDVRECAVVGVPSQVDGGEDEVMAVIVPRPGSRLDAESVWSWCRGRIPEFAMPRYVHFAESLPKTPTEKVQKAMLRELVRDERRTVDRSTHP